RAAAVTPRLYRAPHGVFSATGVWLIRRFGLAPLLWSKWGRDWERGATPTTIARRATDGIAAGDVVLLHDAGHYAAKGSWQKTAASLPAVVDTIAAAGLEAAALRSCAPHERPVLTH